MKTKSDVNINNANINSKHININHRPREKVQAHTFPFYSPPSLSMPTEDRDKSLCELVRLLKQGKVTTDYHRATVTARRGYKG